MSGTQTQPQAATPAAGPRQARLFLSRLDPWTVEDGLRAVAWSGHCDRGGDLPDLADPDRERDLSSINQTISDLGGSGSSGLDVSDAFRSGA